jgi:anti-sigma factor RsiW
MNCDEVRRMLDAYLDGELDLTRQLDVETHLPGCATCRDAAEDITTFCSLVRSKAPVYKGPPELKAKIRAALRKKSKPRCGWFSQFSLPLAYAAAVLVLSFGLAWTWRTFSGSVATLQVARDRLAGCSFWPLPVAVYSSGGNLNRK